MQQNGTKSRLWRAVLLSGSWYGYVGRRTIWLCDTLMGGIISHEGDVCHCLGSFMRTCLTVDLNLKLNLCRVRWVRIISSFTRWGFVTSSYWPVWRCSEAWIHLPGSNWWPICLRICGRDLPGLIVPSPVLQSVHYWTIWPSRVQQSEIMLSLLN